jgi:hypothetical protein
VPRHPSGCLGILTTKHFSPVLGLLKGFKDLPIITHPKRCANAGVKVQRLKTVQGFSKGNQRRYLRSNGVKTPEDYVSDRDVLRPNRYHSGLGWRMPRIIYEEPMDWEQPMTIKTIRDVIMTVKDLELEKPMVTFTIRKLGEESYILMQGMAPIGEFKTLQQAEQAMRNIIVPIIYTYDSMGNRIT